MSVSKVTAFHESGHAVAALLCGESIYRIQLPKNGRAIDTRGRDVSCVGLTETSLTAQPPFLVRNILGSLPDHVELLKTRALNVVFGDGAGPAAEARTARQNLLTVWYRQSGDFAASMSALEPFVADETERRRAVFEVWDAAATIIRGAAVWPAVVALAEALLTGVEDGEELDRIGRRLLPQAPESPVSHALVSVQLRGVATHPA